MTASWKPNPDGEYNEHESIINGKRVVIFSDRAGESWDCRIDDEDACSLDATSKHEAMREAEDLAKN